MSTKMAKKIIKSLKIKQSNIIVVYEEVDVDKLPKNDLVNQIQSNLRLEKPPLFSSFPDFIAIIAPALQIACVIDKKRLHVNDGSQTKIGERDVPSIVLSAHKIIGKPIRAYGFNYDLVFTVKGRGQTGKLIRDAFLKKPEALEKKLNGNIFAGSLRVFFVRNKVRYDIRIEPEFQGMFETTQNINVKANIHHEKGGKLPEKDTLKKCFIKGCGSIEEIILNLFPSAI